MPGPDGGDIRLHYLWEDNGYGQSPNDSDAKIWGANATLDTNEVQRNGTRVRLPASRTAVDVAGANIEGAFAVSFGLTNPWWFRSIRGSPSQTDNGDGTYTYTWNGTPDPFRIIEGFETTDETEVLEGCVARRAVVNPAVGENTVGVTLEGFYKKSSADTPDNLTAQPSLSEDTLDFGDATLSKGGSAIAIMQNATLTLEWPNLQPIVGWGSKFAIDYGVHNFDPTLDYTRINTSPPGATDIYGNSSTSMQEDIESKPSVTMDFDNGASGTDTNQIAFNGSGAFPDSYSEESGGDVTALLQETHGRLVQDVTLEATNSTATAP